MRYGINSWAWALPVDDSNLDAFLDWAVALDLPGDRPLIEVFASPNPDDLPAARALRDKATARGFGVVACGFNPYENAPGDPNPHLVSPDADEREAAIARACGFVDYAAAVAAEGEPGVLSGPWHTRHMHFTGAGLSADERGRLLDGLRRIADRAEAAGVLAGFEVLNRFESYVLNTVGDALDVIRELGSAHIGLNWDASHALTDEPGGLDGSLREAAESGHLFHVHVCENHRGEFGTGPIGRQTRDLLGILRDAGYTRGVVPVLFCEALDGAVHKWIRREGDVTGAAQRSIHFLAACR
jgi:D-psicose/D-tagatose/L-ribulose 3-epimerase